MGDRLGIEVLSSLEIFLFVVFSYLLNFLHFIVVNIWYINFYIVTILSVQFDGINYIHNIIQHLPLFPELFHHGKQKLCPH